MKLSFGWIGIGLGVIIAGSAVTAVKLRNERPVVVINGENITRSRLYVELEKAHGAEVLRRLIQERLVFQEASKKGLLPTPAQIQAEIAQMREVEPDLDRQLRLRGKTMEDLTHDVRGRLALANLIASDVKLPEAEVQRIWAAHQKEFNRPEGRKVEMIVAKTRAIGEKARRLLADGIPVEFASRNAGMALPAGRSQLILFRGQLPSAFEKQVFALKPGQISSVLAMGKAFGVVKVVENIPARQKSFDEVKERLLLAAKVTRGKSGPELLQALQNAATIEIKSDRYKGLADTALAANAGTERVAQATK